MMFSARETLETYREGIEKIAVGALLGSGFRMAGKLGLSAFKNPLKTVGAGFTALEIGGAARKGARVGMPSVKMNTGTNF